MTNGLIQTPHEEAESVNGGPEPIHLSAESGLPMPSLPRRHRDVSAYYTLTTVGHNGRLADRSLIRKLDWTPGRRLALNASGDGTTADSTPTGDQAITRQGFLMLPAAVRHRCDIRYRDRVFVAAYTINKRLVIWPLSALDDMVVTRLPDPQTRSTDGRLG
jgi:hypothetical protein